MIAWDIFALAEGLHCTGSSVLVSFDKKFWKKAAQTQAWTFAERMEKIVELLSRSKSPCEKLFAGGGLQAIVAMPEVLLQSTRVNVVHNVKRQ